VNITVKKGAIQMPLKLNLQFFSAEDGGFGGYDPSSAYEGISVPQSEPQVQPQGQGEPVQQQQVEPSLLDFGGRKLPANDDLMGLHKDYTEQQRYITALQEQVNAYKQLAQTVQPQGQPQQPQQPQNQMPEMPSNFDEDGWAKFYDSAPQVIAEIARQEAQRLIQQQLAETVEPIIQERNWNNEIQRMYDRYPNFGDFIGDVQLLIEQDARYAQPGGLEDAYFRAVATKGMQQPQPQQLAQDPQVQQMVLNNYFQQKQQSNAQIPAAMGRGAGGMTPQTPADAPQTIKQASKLFLKQLGL
jgi:hypothetical protein